MTCSIIYTFALFFSSIKPFSGIKKRPGSGTFSALPENFTGHFRLFVYIRSVSVSLTSCRMHCHEPCGKVCDCTRPRRDPMICPRGRTKYKNKFTTGEQICNRSVEYKNKFATGALNTTGAMIVRQGRRQVKAEAKECTTVLD